MKIICMIGVIAHEYHVSGVHASGVQSLKVWNYVCQTYDLIGQCTDAIPEKRPRSAVRLCLCQPLTFKSCHD